MEKLDFLKDIWHLTRTYFSSEEKWYARGMAAVLILFELGFVGLNVVLTYWNNAFYNSLQHLDFKEFTKLLVYFMVLVAALIIVFVYKYYLGQLLQIRWRTWLTHRYLEKYLTEQAYYGLQARSLGTDNPDQRISDDINSFIQQTLSLSLGFLNSVVSLISFIFVLWSLSGVLTIPLGQASVTIHGYMVWSALLYAGIGTWLMMKIGRPMINLNFQQQTFEASFRFALARFRENVESVAFYRGENEEHLHFKKLFGDVITNFRAIMGRFIRMNWFLNGYSNASTVFPFLMAAPRFFSGAIQLGDLMQIGSVFGNVQSALSFFINSYPQIADWRASTQRLTEFTRDMQAYQAIKLQSPFAFKTSTDNSIHLRDVNIHLPTGESLLQLNDFKLAPGGSILITGSSGTGKSTLLRTIAGIWQHGNGSIHLPINAKLAFSPQKPYMPLGSLARAIVYPLQLTEVPQATLSNYMQRCGLAHLQTQLDDKQDWSRILSLGEQQRIGFVRLLLQKPDWIFLDEATSSLDEPAEAALYELLETEIPNATLVSVGHRSTLNGFHPHKLNLARMVV